MKKILHLSLPMWIFCALSMNLIAQTPEELYKKGNEFRTSEKYLEAAEQYTSAVVKESEEAEPDLHFMAMCADSAAICYQVENYHQEAVLLFEEALRIYLILNDKAAAEKLTPKLAIAHWSTIELNQELTGSAIPYQVIDTADTYFTIKKIEKTTTDSAYVTINGGSTDGLEVGMTGFAVETYNAEIERNFNLGNATVISVGPNESLLGIKLKAPNDLKGKLLVGDMVTFDFGLENPYYKSIFTFLNDLNINFLTIDKYPFYSRRTLWKNDSPLLEYILLEQMAEDVRATAASVKDLAADNPSWTAPLEGGRYKGIGMLEAMEKTTAGDMLAFLLFVNSYPGKYMGIEYKINETYATWLINNTLEGDATGYFNNRIKRTMTDEEVAIFAKVLPFQLDSATTQQMIVSGEAFYIAQDTITAWLVFNNIEKLAAAAKATRPHSMALAEKGYIKWVEQDQVTAMQYFDQSITTDSTNVNALLWRANLLGTQENYKKAIEDYKRVVAIHPSNAQAYGNMGWYYILLGEWNKAKDPVMKAYNIDSTSLAYAVNLGHIHLFEDDTTNAYKYYRKTLTLLSSEKDYLEGPMGDFEIFLNKGWNKKAVSQAKYWMDAEYQTTYHYYFEMYKYWEKGAELYKEGKYAESAAQYALSVETERKSKRPRVRDIHNGLTWIGYNHYHLKNYDEALKIYLEALDMARNSLNPDDISNDLYLLEDVYKAKGMEDQAAVVRTEAVAIDKKRNTPKPDQVNLYIMSFGVNNYSTKADTAAAMIADFWYQRSINCFNNGFKQSLTGKNATKAGINQAFDQITSKETNTDKSIEVASANDILIFYFSGDAVATGTDINLIPFGADKSNASASISLTELKQKLDKLPVKNQMILLDIPVNSTIERLLTSNLKDINRIIIAPDGVPVINISTGYSYFSNALVEGLQGAANLDRSDFITAKELEDYMFRKMQADAYSFSLQSYSKGLNFIVGRYSDNDISPPKIALYKPEKMRGKKEFSTADATFEIVGQAQDESGIYKITIDKVDAQVGADGTFASVVKLAFGDNEIIISAEDTKNNVAYDTLIVKRSETAQDLQIVSKKGRNYALLIGIEAYDEWESLANPVNDAKTIKKVLDENYEFETKLLPNPTIREILVALNELSEKTFSDNDQIFIFIAGHGDFDEKNKIGYLVGKDAKVNDPFREVGYRSYLDLRQRIDQINCKHIMLVLDVCYGGTFNEQIASGDRSGKEDYKLKSKEEYYEEIMKYRSRICITSSGNEKVPDGISGFHSPFAYSLIEFLKTEQKEGYIFADKLYERLKMLPSKPRMHTFGFVEPQGSFAFVAKKKNTEIKF